LEVKICGHTIDIGFHFAGTNILTHIEKFYNKSFSVPDLLFKCRKQFWQ